MLNSFSDSFIADGKVKSFDDFIRCYIDSAFYELAGIFNFFRG